MAQERGADCISCAASLPSANYGIFRNVHNVDRVTHCNYAAPGRTQDDSPVPMLKK